MSWVRKWLKEQGLEGKPVSTTPPPTELAYKFMGDEKIGPILAVEIPVLTQTPELTAPVMALSSGGRTHEARNSFHFMYLHIECATGRVSRLYSEGRGPLEELHPDLPNVVTAGWTFMLGALELVNANQFTNHPYPPSWSGFNTMWDIAAMMENGERALLARSAHPQDLMLKFSNQLRMLIAPIQAAQRPNRPDHIRLFKLLKAGETGPESEALRAKLAAHYAATFTPPELLF